MGSPGDKSAGQVKRKEAQPQPGQSGEDGEEHEIASLLKYWMAVNGNGAVELLVYWADEKEDDATREAKEAIQKGAEEALYTHWTAQGRRTSTLPFNPKKPPSETYHAFKALNHIKKARGIFQYKVQ
ncbi:hypothetical protein DL769_001297 [Monosporascus sp. CRB-8-3]|nr:hypothetical protein DL769_001297 [Monosporascus sp. CRB-8-3]